MSANLFCPNGHSAESVVFEGGTSLICYYYHGVYWRAFQYLSNEYLYVLFREV